MKAHDLLRSTFAHAGAVRMQKIACETDGRADLVVVVIDRRQGPGKRFPLSQDLERRIGGDRYQAMIVQAPALLAWLDIQLHCSVEELVLDQEQRKRFARVVALGEDGAAAGFIMPADEGWSREELPTIEGVNEIPLGSIV